ncbi:MAG: HlyD family efflux transporter periplasmic adaptor subunit [Clostridia bacterium]
MKQHGRKGADGMQPDQYKQSNGGEMPYTPEQMWQWQQPGMPPQPMSPPPMPDLTQQMWQQGGQNMPFPQMTPEQMAQMQYEASMQQLQQQQMPTMQQMPPMQSTGKRSKHHPKKNGKGGNLRSVVALVVAVAAIGGIAFYFYQSMKPAAQATATIEMGTLGTSYTGDALIVRNETAYDEEGVQSIDYIAQEGGVVYRGDVICYVYSTGYSTKEINVLQDYRDQIKNYQRTLLKGETAYDQKMAKLESDVVERGLEVRSLVQGARGNLVNQEKILQTAIKQRQAYFRSKYSSDMRLNRLFDDETTQQSRIDSWIKQKGAMEERIVSFYTDGFEHALTPAKFEQYTPVEVRAMMNGQKPAVSTASRGRTDLYRLVKQNNYAVLMLIKDNTWNPIEGNTYKLVLEQFSNTVVEAKVISFTRAGGELLVRLAVIGDVKDVLYMRTCQAQLGEYVDCMVVPESALHKQTDDSGAVSTGVVLVTGTEQYFVPVKIQRQEGGKAYISAIQTGVLTAGQTVRLFK